MLMLELEIPQVLMTTAELPLLKISHVVYVILATGHCLSKRRD